MKLLKCTTHGPRQTITPLPDGIETEFLCSHGMAPGTDSFNFVWQNSALMHEGSTEDYTLSPFQEAVKIIFDTAPPADSKLDTLFYGIGGS